MPRLRFRIAPPRRVARRTALGLCGALAAGFAAACTTGNTLPDPSGAGGRGDAGAGASAAPSVSLSMRALSLEGQPVDALALDPLQTVKLVATARPSVRSMRFALSGDALDAVLKDTDVSASTLNGTAETFLTAPSAPRSFYVRVTATGAATYFFPVEVPSTGIAKLEVQPVYSGRRSIPEYTATVQENTTCAALSGAPPDDGPASATSSTWPVPLEVTAGVPLAVILRVGKFIWGCTTVDAATEGVVKEVSVTLRDVPIKLDDSQVSFTLTLDHAEPFADALLPAREALLAELVGDASDDVEALLDAMRDRADDASSFSSTRRAETWDSVLREALPNAAEALRGPLRGWIARGIEALDLEQAVVGELRGAEVEGTPPEFTLDSAFGLSPALSTFASAGDTLWTAQADDTVLIGVGLTFDPAGFQLGTALAPALEDDSDATDLANALAIALSCEAVATTLLAHGESSKTSYSGCGRSCTEELCRAGVRYLYEKAAAPAEERATLDVALAGAGGVGVLANLTALSGTWLGKLSTPAVGTEPAPDDAPAAGPISLTGLASARDPTATDGPSR